MDNTDKTKSQVPEPYYEEDEINLLDLLLVILKHKKMIFYMVFIAGLLAVVISLLLPNIYRSEATITLRPEESASSPIAGLGGLGDMVAGQFGLGGNEGLQKLNITLNSRELTKRVIEKYNLMPEFFKDEWDSEKKRWLDEEAVPTLQDAYKLIIGNLLTITINEDSANLVIGFENEQPGFSKKMVEYYATELSTMLREEVLSDAGEKKKYFTQQLSTITDSLLREKIYGLLAKEIEKETFAKAQTYYGFLLIDPPIAPDLDKKVSPKRAIICILSVFVAFFFSIFLAFLLEFIQRIKTEDPERYNAIVKELKFWKRPHGSNDPSAYYTD